MNNSGTCVSNGQSNNAVVIIQKQPIHQRSTTTNEETEDDSDDDMYDDEDMDAQSGDESMNANEEKITSQLGSFTFEISYLIYSIYFIHIIEVLFLTFQSNSFDSICWTHGHGCCSCYFQYKKEEKIICFWN